MAKKDKSFNQRSSDEKAEGYETVKTGLPSERFQTEKQVVSPDEMGVTANSQSVGTANVGEKAAKSLKSKIKLRPDVSVDDLGGKQVGGVPLAVETGLKSVAGARSMSPADDMSRTPYSSGDYRPATRYGKKRSEDLFELDNTATEQVVPIVEDLGDLKADPEGGVGYNGRQQFKQTRQKKNFAYVNGNGDEVIKCPQQLLNDASVDFVDKNAVVYTTGQVVNAIDDSGNYVDIDSASDYPTYSGDDAIPNASVMHKGNYMPTGLRITIANGQISNVSIDEKRYVAPATPIVRDECNTNWQIDGNNIAKTMVKIQTEMGRETTDKWTPLAYVIHQPYQYNMLMHDIEATTGAIMAAAYRSAVSSLAYQRNITKKDGINPQRNAIKMIYEDFAGILANNSRNTIADLDFNHMLWNQEAYRLGSSAAIIAMFDSTGKYRTKADLLGLQRSFGLHLSQCDNNINPLHCKSTFIKALDKAHMFSTVDGEYNPFLPIYETKEIKLINPLSLNKFLVNWKNPKSFIATDFQDIRRDKTTGTYAQYVYKYSDLRNEYTTRVQHPVIEGLLMWLLKHEGAFVSTYGNGEVYIPFHFDFQNPGMLSFMLCSAAQDVAFQRNISFRDVLFAGEQSTYIWDDLEGLDKLNPLYSSQLKIGKYDEPLVMGKLASDSAIRMFFMEHMQLTDDADGVKQYFLPWTMNEQAFAKTAGGDYAIQRGFYNPDTPFNFSYPSIRDGVRHEYIDLIKSMTPQDVMLALDRKLDIPRFVSSDVITDADGNTLWTEIVPYMDTTTNSGKIKLSALRYDPNSDGRMVVKYDLDAGGNYDLLAEGFYCIPKQIGFIDDYYLPLTVLTRASYSNNHLVLDQAQDTLNFTDKSGVNTDYYNGGLNMWVTSYREEADAPSNGSIDRSAALTATFYRFFAAPDAVLGLCNAIFVNETGLILSPSYNDGAPTNSYGVYNLGSNNESTHAIDINISSNAGYVWTMLQRFFMPINPFANSYVIRNAAHSFDPFETAFWFGVCGFLAADYTQYVLERLSRIDQLGMDYTEDPNITKSLIFR